MGDVVDPSLARWKFFWGWPPLCDFNNLDAKKPPITGGDTSQSLILSMTY